MLSKAIVGEMDQREPIWELSAQSIVQFLIGYTLEALPKEDHNMITVCKLYHMLIGQNGINNFTEWVDDNPNSFPALKLNEFRANANADKMIASVYGFINVALTPYELPEATSIFGPGHAVDTGKLGHKKMVIFLEVSDVDHSFDSIQNLIFTQTIHNLFRVADQSPDGKLPVPVTIMMDDFGANTNIPDIDKIISVTRSRDIGFSLIIQSLSQLNSIYGTEKAKTILNNCDTIVYMGVQDIETVEYIGRRTGKNHESIFALPRDKQYIITSGQKPKLIDKLKPYHYMRNLPSKRNQPNQLTQTNNERLEKTGYNM